MFDISTLRIRSTIFYKTINANDWTINCRFIFLTRTDKKGLYQDFIAPQPALAAHGPRVLARRTKESGAAAGRGGHWESQWSREAGTVFELDVPQASP